MSTTTIAAASTPVGTKTTGIVQPSGRVGKKELGKEDFMKLFITELQYQDPSKPMDSNEMASQLAQFSSMEATVKMSDNMEKLLANQTSQNNIQLLTMLNTQVQTAGNTVAVSEGKVSTSMFQLKAPAGSATIEVRDAADNLIFKQDKGALVDGIYAVGWDGKDLLGRAVPDGAYTYKITGTNLDGSSLDVTYNTTATVTGVNFNGGTAQLTLDKYITAGLTDVTKVMASAAAAATPAATTPPATTPAATEPAVPEPDATASGQ